MKCVTRIEFDNDKVYVSYDYGERCVQPLSNAWLWVLGAIHDGTPIVISDARDFLEKHQYNLSCCTTT